MATFTPKDITIAVTVYDRRNYITQAIESALGQRCPEQPQVIVLEDCGPDPTLRETVCAQFGSRINYLRNSRRRGLFDNWNACIESCRTPWLCILHDDDLLEPTFVQSMMALVRIAPNRGLYYGRCEIVDETGRRIGESHAPDFFCAQELSLAEWAMYDPVCFPGHLFSVASARGLGGFRASSRYTGDWDLWFKLAVSCGSAATDRILAKYRQHHSIGRGTTKADVSGRKYAYVNVQRKRNVAYLRRLQPIFRFDRMTLQKQSSMSLRFILCYGYNFSNWIFRYNARLLALSHAPNITYRGFQILNQVLSWRSLRLVSQGLRLLRVRLKSPDASHSPAHRTVRT